MYSPSKPKTAAVWMLVALAFFYVFIMIVYPITGNATGSGSKLIRGIRKSDAEKVLNDIFDMFRGDKFVKFRELIKLNKKHIQIDSIRTEALVKAFEDVELSEDEKALIWTVVDAINSTSKHLVEYRTGDRTDFYSRRGTKYLRMLRQVLTDTLLKAILYESGGRVPGGMVLAAYTVPARNGSYSAIRDGLQRYGGRDYYNSGTKKYEKQSPAGRTSVTGHEIFGHGILAILKRNAISHHVQSIRFENLILRIMGFGNIHRDGMDHDKGVPVDDPSILHDYYKKDLIKIGK